MNKFVKTFGKFWYLYVIGIMSLAFFVIATSKKQLQAYRSGIDSSIYTIDSEQETEENVPMTAYKADNIDLLMQVPDGWPRITKDGFDTFVDQASGTSIQIQVLDYYPEVNNVSEEYLTDSLYGQGYTLSEYYRDSGNTYTVIYNKSNESGVIDYLEYVVWDRKHVVKIKAVFNDKYFTHMKTAVKNTLNSIQWNYEDPISDGFYLVYKVDGDFEFAVPLNWSYGETDGAAFAQDPDTGATLTVTLNPASVYANQITQIDYTGLVGEGKQNYQLQGFAQYDDHVHGEASYTVNGEQAAVVQDLYANGAYLYLVSYECPYTAADSLYPAIIDGLGMTRIFYDPDRSESEGSNESDMLGIKSDNSENASSMFEIPDGAVSEEKQPETSPPSSESSGTDDTGLSSLASGLTPPSETTANADTTDMAGDDTASASTLAGALVQLANISDASAVTIENIWTGLTLGTPVDANAIKANDTTIVIQVTTDMNVNYFLFIRKLDGYLEQITVNTDAGQQIYVGN